MFASSITPEEIAALQLASFPGEIVVIDAEGEAFDKAVAYLKKQKVLGFDTETRPTFTTGRRSCSFPAAGRPSFSACRNAGCRVPWLPSWPIPPS